MSEDGRTAFDSHTTEDGRAAFDSHASEYETQCMEGLSLSGESKAYFAEGRIAFLRAWWESEGRPAPETIVDYGCGVGDVAPLLAEAFPASRIVGVDPSSACIARANEQFAGERIRFETMEGFRAEEADLIHLNGVVHHVPPAEREALFGALAAATRAGGVVALFENNPANPGTRLVMSRIPFDRDAVLVWPLEARRRLRAAGLSPEITRYLFYFPAALGALRPAERWLGRVPLGAQYGVLAVRDA